MSKRNIHRKKDQIHLPNFKAHARRRRVDARTCVNWNAIIGDDAKFYRIVLTQIETLRLLKMIPSWEQFTNGPTWVDDIRPFLDGKEKRRYRAVWELVQEVTGISYSGRLNTPRVALAIHWTREEEVKQRWGQEYVHKIAIPLTPAMAKIDAKTEARLRHMIEERYEDFFPWN